MFKNSTLKSNENSFAINDYFSENIDDNNDKKVINSF